MRAFAENPPARRVRQRLAVGGRDRLRGLRARLADMHFEHMVAVALWAVRVRRHDIRLETVDALVVDSLAHLALARKISYPTREGVSIAVNSEQSTVNGEQSTVNSQRGSLLTA